MPKPDKSNLLGSCSGEFTGSYECHDFIYCVSNPFGYQHSLTYHNENTISPHRNKYTE